MNGATLMMKKRLLFLLVAFSFYIRTLFRVAGFNGQGAELQEMPLSAQNSNREITPKRGTIHDRNE